MSNSKDSYLAVKKRRSRKEYKEIILVLLLVAVGFPIIGAAADMVAAHFTVSLGVVAIGSVAIGILGLLINLGSA
jgi:preprotein translocase subunit Sss1